VVTVIRKIKIKIAKEKKIKIGKVPENKMEYEETEYQKWKKCKIREKKL
jgi:hypothetical protein